MKDILKGSVGTGVTFGAVAVSRLETVKEWLQVTSLIIGVVVGILTAISVCMTIRWKIKHIKERQNNEF